MLGGKKLEKVIKKKKKVSKALDLPMRHVKAILGGKKVAQPIYYQD